MASAMSHVCRSAMELRAVSWEVFSPKRLSNRRKGLEPSLQRHLPPYSAVLMLQTDSGSGIESENSNYTSETATLSFVRQEGRLWLDSHPARLVSVFHSAQWPFNGTSAQSIPALDTLSWVAFDLWVGALQRHMSAALWENRNVGGSSGRRRGVRYESSSWNGRHSSDMGAVGSSL